MESDFTFHFYFITLLPSGFKIILKDFSPELNNSQINSFQILKSFFKICSS